MFQIFREVLMSENKGINLTFIVVLFAALFFFFAFGINALYLTQQLFHFKLDRGQFWTISVIISVALYIALFFIRQRNWKKSVVAYLIVNLSVAGIDLALYFLFKLPFLKQLVFTAFGIKW